MSFQVVCLNDHFCSAPKRIDSKIKSKNKAPCTGPIACTKAGLCHTYFIGTAIKISRSSEIPSKKANRRKRPMAVVKNWVMVLRKGKNSSNNGYRRAICVG